jgi:hypothetical protein
MGGRTGPSDKEILSLHRYFFWAGCMRGQFSERLRAAKNEQDRINAHFLEPYLPCWYAGMYTLVDGWKRLQLADSGVDALLDAKRLALLERFRHGVYHFHPEYYDEKFRGFWAQGREIQNWVDELFRAFDAFFRGWFRQRYPTAEQTQGTTA